MKVRLIALTIGIVVLGVLGLSGQSARTDTKTDSKRNSRPAQPSPTPTPAATVAGAAAVDKPALPDDGEIIKVNTQLVAVPVRVMDKKGRFIGGLARENFKVFEDGAEQEISLFSNEHEPFTVALVLDMSYSTTFKIAEIQNAAIEFIDQLRPKDRVMVVSFDEEVHILCEATNDRQAIYRAIKSTKIATGTSLYEAIDLVINNRLRRIDGRKAIILFTDGVDTTSRRSNDYDNLNDALELDSLIYSIRYDTFADVQKMKNGGIVAKPPVIVAPVPQQGGSTIPFPLPSIGAPSTIGTTEEEYRKAEEYLTKLADNTGGRIYQATSLGNLADAYSKIASELREFYSIGYYPQEDHTPGKRTNVKIKVDQPGLVVRSREGYIRRRDIKLK
jgi:Ca-activated chloride channel family protein